MISLPTDLASPPSWDRLRWLATLHRITALVFGVFIVLCWAVAPIEAGLWRGALLVAVAGGVSVWLDRLASAHGREDPQPLRDRIVLNAAAVMDVGILVTAVHWNGGSEAPGLVACIVPMFVYGMFVPRRDAMAQAVLAWSILSVVFLGEATGLLAHTCPPLPGARCQVRSSGVAFSRSLAMGFTMMVAAHITSFIGESLRRQEAQTRSLSREYLALAEQKLGFVTMVAHEFRTPVSVIQMVSETLGRYGDRLTPTQRQERQRKIHRAARQLTTLLDDVLALGRSRSSAARFEFAPVDFDALCHEVAEQVHFDPAARGGGAIDVQADAGVIVGDAELLRRILRNLLTNAVKYSPGGTPVGLQTRREDQTVVLTVRDSGMGIPLEDQPRLFHPFVRASNVGGVAGSGLGLAIVREAVTAHGGTIDVESAVGRGTTMIVRLPVQAPVTRAA